MPPKRAYQLSAADGLAQLSFLIQGALQRLAADYDVSMVQMRLLGILRDREPTMKELAALLGLDKSSTTGLVDRAESAAGSSRESPRRSTVARLGSGSRTSVARSSSRSRSASRPRSRRCSAVYRRGSAAR